jgi:hypothetical protein
MVVAAAMVIGPGYALLGNRIRPFVLGLPFSLVWVVAWLLLTFLALLVWEARRGRMGR